MKQIAECKDCKDSSHCEPNTCIHFLKRERGRRKKKPCNSTNP